MKKLATVRAKRTQRLERRRCRSVDGTGFHWHYTKERRYEEVGTAEVALDVDAIVERLARDALDNRTRRAVEIGGLVKAKVIKSVILDDVTVDIPCPEGYELL